MLRLATILLIAGLVPAMTRADDKAKTAPSPGFAALKKEFDDAYKKWMDAAKASQQAAKKAMEDAKTDDEKKAAQKKMMTRPDGFPVPIFAPRFFEFAEKNPQDSSACDAIHMALRMSGGPTDANGIWNKAIALCQAHFVANPEIKKIVRTLGGADDPPVEKLLNAVATKNPDRRCQALAYKALASARENTVQMAEQIKANPQARKEFEQQLGKDKIEKAVAGADKAKKEMEEYSKIVKDKYSDIFPDLSVGKAAPEVVIQDVNGKEAKLSALKGRVVVLDIWATWCGPCRGMIPHEREMCEKLKDKPFTLVSISCDNEKKTLVDFLAKEKMPWTHWWNGAEGGISEDWDVQYFPTIYVLDAKGIIRNKDKRGDELEKVVNELLKEMEK